MSLIDMLNWRRSVRDYLPVSIDKTIVQNCLKTATLAPTSSNMQLYEFYHVTDKDKLNMLAKACLSQGAARTADQMVVFVVRPDLYKKHAKQVFEFEKDNIKTYVPVNQQNTRLKQAYQYYHCLIPVVYGRTRTVAIARKALAEAIGVFRPSYMDLSEANIQTSIHKSCALVAMSFMLAMSEQGLDTCPMEGFDSKRIKKLLNLPKDSQISLVVACGLRSDKGVWGERFRLPFDELYQEI